LREFSGKKIAVDISIYLYKYSALIENIYLMLSIFKHYGIIPIFIFDGKPPTEKKALLQKRKQDKVDAQKEYNELNTELHNPKNNLSRDDKEEIMTSLDLLKKQFVYIKRDQINQVKELIVSYGAAYYDAPGEADVLCAQLVLSGKVWACMSEDMDMFVYGVPRVLRYFSLLNHTAVVYYTENVLKRLDMTQEELRMICALVNNDYNCLEMRQNNDIDIYKAVEMYNTYKNASVTQSNSVCCEFYTWIKNNNLLKNVDILMQNFDMFMLPPLQVSVEVEEAACDYKKMQDILIQDGFVFL